MKRLLTVLPQPLIEQFRICGHRLFQVMQESVTPATESDKNFEEFKNFSELFVDESVTCVALRRNELVGQCFDIFRSDTMTLVWLNVGWFKSGSFLYLCALL